jgi:hypothetical protein
MARFTSFGPTNAIFVGHAHFDHMPVASTAIKATCTSFAWGSSFGKVPLCDVGLVSNAREDGSFSVGDRAGAVAKAWFWQ